MGKLKKLNMFNLFNLLTVNVNVKVKGNVPVNAGEAVPAFRAEASPLRVKGTLFLEENSPFYFFRGFPAL